MNRLKRLTRGGAAVLALFLVVLTASPAAAAPTLTISATTGLTDGQRVDISGSGFEPNLTSIAIGQCVEGYTGPADCNTNGGATFRNADASGNVAQFTITVKAKFGAHDCTKVQCVIAGAPLPNATDQATVDANTYIAKISFGGAPTGTPTTGSDASDLPKTGAGDSVPVLLLGALALLATGAGVMLLVPAGRRGDHA